MAWYDNITQGDFENLLRRVYRLENRTTTVNTAIGRSGLTVYDGGIITIENGGLRVTGTAEVVGRLFASGLVNLAGEVVISGPLDVSGTMDVSGLVKLMSDLEVHSGGRIKAGSIELSPDGSAKFASLTISPDGTLETGSAKINPDGSAKFGSTTISPTGVIKSGNTVIDPSAGNGGFTFESGGGVGGNGGNVLLRGSSNAGVLATVNASLFAGASSVDVRPDGVYVPGLPTSSEKPNVYADSSGKLFRSTAAI